MLGGLAPVTTIAVVFTGIVGAMLLPVFLKCIGVRNEVQMGLSIGTAAHAVGTSRAIELGETEGAMSGACDRYCRAADCFDRIGRFPALIDLKEMHLCRRSEQQVEAHRL